jgi:hypothetical protein
VSIIKSTCPRCKFEYSLVAVHDLNRTNRQNSLYWGVYIPTCADHFGYFPDEMHEEWKLMFLGVDSKLTPGAKVGGSTTKLTTKQFKDYLEKIIIWATQQGIQLPMESDHDTKRHDIGTS